MPEPKLCVNCASGAHAWCVKAFRHRLEDPDEVCECPSNIHK